MFNLKFILSEAIYAIVPFLGNALSMLIGIAICNSFWKRKIYRYANATIQKTLIFQETTMDRQAKEIIDKDEEISDLKGILYNQKVSVQTMMNRLNGS